MAHTTKDKAKLLIRVRRIRDRWKQLKSASTANTNVLGCFNFWPLVVVRLNGLMAEVLEGHIRFHVLAPGNCQERSPQVEAAEELIDVVRHLPKVDRAKIRILHEMSESIMTRNGIEFFRSCKELLEDAEKSLIRHPRP